MKSSPAAAKQKLPAWVASFAETSELLAHKAESCPLFRGVLSPLRGAESLIQAKLETYGAMRGCGDGFFEQTSVPPPQQRRNTEMPDDTPFAHLFLCSLPRVHNARGPSLSDGPRSRHPGSPPLPRPRIVNHVTSAHGGLELGELTFLVSHARRRCCDDWRSTRDRRQRKASELIHGNLLGWRDL